MSSFPFPAYLGYTDDTAASEDQRLLLYIDQVCADANINIPWNDVAVKFEPRGDGLPALTGEAVKQHLAKLRAKREEDGLDVPPKVGRSVRRVTATKVINTNPTTITRKRKAIDDMSSSQSVEGAELANRKPRSNILAPLSKTEQAKRNKAAAKERLKANASNVSDMAHHNQNKTVSKSASSGVKEGDNTKTSKKTKKPKKKALSDSSDVDGDDYYHVPDMHFPPYLRPIDNGLNYNETATNDTVPDIGGEYVTERNEVVDTKNDVSCGVNGRVLLKKISDLDLPPALLSAPGTTAIDSDAFSVSNNYDQDHAAANDTYYNATHGTFLGPIGDIQDGAATSGLNYTYTNDHVNNDAPGFDANPNNKSDLDDLLANLDSPFDFGDAAADGGAEGFVDVGQDFAAVENPALPDWFDVGGAEVGGEDLGEEVYLGSSGRALGAQGLAPFDMGVFPGFN